MSLNVVHASMTMDLDLVQCSPCSKTNIAASSIGSKSILFFFALTYFFL